MAFAVAFLFTRGSSFFRTTLFGAVARKCANISGDCRKTGVWDSFLCFIRPSSSPVGTVFYGCESSCIPDSMLANAAAHKAVNSPGEGCGDGAWDIRDFRY
jgi:hypothetical protein